MPKVKVLLFDLDGTISDSREAIYPAIEHALSTHGILSVSRDTLSDTIHDLREIHAAHASDVVYASFFDTYSARVAELLSSVYVYEGAVETLKSLRLRGYKFGVVSSSRFAYETVLRHDFSDFFDVIISGLDTKKHKPHPEPIEVALKKLNIDPEDAIMIGDTKVDVIAGKAARVRATVGITHGFGTRDSLVKAKADYIIDSLLDLPGVITKIEQMK